MKLALLSLLTTVVTAVAEDVLLEHTCVTFTRLLLSFSPSLLLSFSPSLPLSPSRSTSSNPPRTP